jgi:AraC-like DNA-binding protein
MLRDDVLVEWYRYPPGPPVVLPTHSHEQYQLNVNLDLPGGVRYRGGYHVLPARSLAVIMPGEVHTPRDCDARDDVSAHLTLYVNPSTMGEAAPGHRGLPFFRDLIVDAPEVVSGLVRLHATLSGRAGRSGPPPAASALEQDVRLVTLFADLVERYAGVRIARPRRPAHRAVRRAQDYLHANCTANVSLAELARVSGLSRYHLTRLFTASVGVPPHAYQLQLRVDHAKRILLGGRRGASDAAHETGFFDLSHFSRHFKRHVGVSPGAYARHALDDNDHDDHDDRKVVHPLVPASSYRPRHARREQR